LPCLAHPHDHWIYPSTPNVKPGPRVPYHDHPPTLYKLNFISMHSVPLFKNIQTKPARHTVWIPSTICSDLYANPPPTVYILADYPITSDLTEHSLRQISYPTHHAHNQPTCLNQIKYTSISSSLEIVLSPFHPWPDACFLCVSELMNKYIFFLHSCTLNNVI
jgi:hypothetical protein